jgi:ribulose-5-phosphate 4-epimerase/fuculose-1-phosphate aldolase
MVGGWLTAGALGAIVVVVLLEVVELPPAGAAAKQIPPELQVTCGKRHGIIAVLATGIHASNLAYTVEASCTLQSQAPCLKPAK